MLALSINSVEVYNIPAPTKSKDEPPEAIRIFSLDLPGHRTDVRTLCLSSDDQLLASASNGKTDHLFEYIQDSANMPYRFAQNLEYENDCLHPDDGLRLRNLQYVLAGRSTGAHSFFLTVIMIYLINITLDRCRN